MDAERVRQAREAWRRQYGGGMVGFDTAFLKARVAGKSDAEAQQLAVDAVLDSFVELLLVEPSREEREARRNTTLHAVQRMAQAWITGGKWPERGAPGFEDCETVQLVVAGETVRYEVSDAMGRLLAVIRVEDDGRLWIDEEAVEG